jgi:hypothetical protein
MASIDDLNAQVAVLTSQVNSLLTAVNVQKSYIDVASAIAVSGITGSSGSTLPAAGKSPVGNDIGLFSGAWIDPATLVVSSINGGPLPNGRFGGIGISGQLTTGRSGTFDSGSLASMASAADAGSVELSVGSTSGFETGISLTGNFATNYKGAIRFLTASKESARIDASGNFIVGTTFGNSAQGNIDIGNSSGGLSTTTLHLGYSAVSYYGSRIVNVNTPKEALI